MTKQELRNRVREQRNEQPAVVREASGRDIQEQVLALADFQRGGTIASYIALPGEVPTDLIHETAWLSGKTLCVPAYRADHAGYAFCRLERDDPLEQGPMKVLQPRQPRWMAAGTIDLALVPGMAFDAEGGRVGHGGGHYDRLLAAGAEAMVKVGLAFRFQMFARVPMEARDVRLNRIIVER